MRTLRGSHVADVRRAVAPTGVEWTEWMPFTAVGVFPETTGLYRFRRPGSGLIDYVGETGTGRVSLAKRLRVLRSINADEMPYRYPYSAAPALWALRHLVGEPLELCWASGPDSASIRRATWALEVAQHRQQYRASPTVNFGRMPIGYRSSSSYSCELIHSDGLYRGGPSRAREPYHEPGRAPLGALAADAHSNDWGGGAWSSWGPTMPASGAEGFLRARRRGNEGLIALTHGVLRAAAARIAKQARGIELSWFVIDGWPPHHREEIHTDLLGAYFLHYGRVPGE